MIISIARISKLTILATALTTAGLMQGAQHAIFHLPVAAHWGLALLQPGDYSMSLPMPSAGEPTVRVDGDGKAMRALPIVTDARADSENSYIELWKIDGSYFVRQLSVGPVGKSYTFGVPKAGHKQEVARIAAASATATE